MSDIAVKYTGSGSDYSGYGSANRAFITALYVAGVNVTTEVVPHVTDQTDHGWQGGLMRSLEGKNIPYKVQVIHLTPDEYPNHYEKGKYNIGHLFWETDTLPSEWLKPINDMDEIWASSQPMAELFKKSGVRIPIYHFPQPIDISMADKKVKKYDIPQKNGYMFYSMFQWIKRKNPEDLIKTFWRTFTNVKDVSLLIKTHRLNFDESEFDKIKDDIAKWKRQVVARYHPPIFLCKQLLPQEAMYRIHATGDCYVSANHGEGWDRALHEALLMAKPAISTARGGIHEHLNDDYYFRVPSKYVKVEVEDWIPWYKGDMKWANPDLKALSEKMMYAYKNRDLVKAKGIVAKNRVKDYFSYHRIGKLMLERLNEIYKAL